MTTFGPYLIEIQEVGHAVIRREDGAPAQPDWYELQQMKNIAFGAAAAAIEVFPASVNVVDGAHQRHLWLVPSSKELPCLRTGERYVFRADEGDER